MSCPAPYPEESIKEARKVGVREFLEKRLHAARNDQVQAGAPPDLLPLSLLSRGAGFFIEVAKFRPLKEEAWERGLAVEMKRCTS